MLTEKMLELIVGTLDEGKAKNIKVIDVKRKTTITDYFVVASGTSERHVKSLADQVVEKLKQFRVRPLGIEGEQVGEWVLVDLADVVLHVMLPQTREFYQLEKLWEPDFVLESTAVAG
ncbi:MAG: ribosome silencing factor [Methylococcales bacterium]